MSTFHRILAVAAAAGLTSASMLAQSVISAKSGLVHYVEGDVTVEGKAVSDKPGVFADVKKGGDLSTKAGRAEVLLTPGVFLRVGEQSSVAMRDNTLADTRVELLAGSAMVESDTPMKDNKVTVNYKDYSVTFRKYGLYGFQTEPAQLRVYRGEAEVTAGGQTVIVHEGRELPFTAALAQEKFDIRTGDSLYRWSKLRSEYISIANVSAAKSAGTYGSGLFGTSGFSGIGSGNWFYNSYYGMYTYLPYAGSLVNPFGYTYYSPATVGNFYNNYYYYGSNSLPGTTNTKNSTNSSLLTSTTLPPTPKGGSNLGALGGSVGLGGGHAGGTSGGSHH